MSDKREASDKRDLYSQMDKAAVRTAADIEQKYNIGKSFAEVTGIAEDARAAAATAQKTAESVDIKLDQEEIFRRLTNNGKIQGMRQVGDKYYFSGECIEALEALFAKNINMSGTFTHEVEAFLYPGEEEENALNTMLLSYPPGEVPYTPLFDFNGNETIDAGDLAICIQARLGQYDLSTWKGAVKTPVKMTINLANPEKAIIFSGENMWGREITQYIGVNFTTIESKKTASIADYVVKRGEASLQNESGVFDGFWYYELWNSGIARLTGNIKNRLVNFTTPNGNVFRSGDIRLQIPISLYGGILSVIHNANGVDEAVWGGQAWYPDVHGIVVEAFCGRSATVTTNFYIEVVGKWK